MASLATSLGLRASATINYAPAYLAFHFIWAYGILSSRTLKQIYGIDHQESPRYDLIKYGEAAVKSGKITRSQLNMLQRCESASANSVENYTFFVAALGFATFSGVDRHLVNRWSLAYTVARIAYGISYILIERRRLAQIRGVLWWAGNVSCFGLLWGAYTKSNGRI
ncbi:hypothetical protein QBC38DRAFT_73136 [Podospora fimiseda]|uniref:Uncharacterized protein n=1 Tax=Podospora fimiseda TaxID=252190 RepID=A0AAN6YRN6_9PEZI|nr:hypothetical protein QBC38DRAFT_73136 [Podospora fimiseda]